jgi:hypothetical protein
VIQYTLIDRRFTQAQLLNLFNDAAGALTKAVLKEAVDVIVANTPVDTGTYADNHTVTTGGRIAGRGDDSSHGKPRGQPVEAFREKARARLYAQIAALPDDVLDASIRNSAVHADLVEYTTLGGKNKPARRWQPYGTAKRETNNIIARARMRALRGEP